MGIQHTCGITCGCSGAQHTCEVQSPNIIYVGQGGPAGAQGTQGVQGATGSGTQGTQGTQGLAGSYAAQGAQGSTGPQGTTGAQGATGTGTQGASGSQGAVGNQGTTGAQGTIGAQGTTGSQGLTGVQGTQGNFGIQGTMKFIGEDVNKFMKGIDSNIKYLLYHKLNLFQFTDNVLFNLKDYCKSEDNRTWFDGDIKKETQVTEEMKRMSAIILGINDVETRLEEKLLPIINLPHPDNSPEKSMPVLVPHAMELYENNEKLKWALIFIKAQYLKMH